ncbi:HlyD family efflux transporter periplasmic adaptor subunit [Rhodoferax sp.]|uniref:efflux RND transporter periplasmic adaptor subunit n=1 Tax=Rhodoferax sp. TaxID=50421 RepID=UPI00283D7519|nr:HlyD family efflux transporter periplasmic adaptor subunit [Rhodoferax sp.]MDR3370118.1 HlyD family efflux transporter periplasmic adaptor subunit [Rhodoferax sp.]
MKINTLWKRRTVLLLTGVIVVWGLYAGLRPQAVEVDMAQVSRAALRATLEQEGRTRVLERYTVTAPVAGYARRIALNVGDAVQRDDVLAVLEPLRAEPLDPRQHAEALARIAAAQANVSALQQRANASASTASLAQMQLQRTQSLRLQGHVSAAAEDQAAAQAQSSQADLRSAQFAVTTAQHDLEAARAVLHYATTGSASPQVAVRAPVAGRVLKIVHKSEGSVATGQALVEIGDPHALEVEVDLLSADAVRIHPGTRVVFERWGGDGTLEGVVRLIEPAAFTKVSALGVEEQRVWVIVSFTSPASRWQGLGDGYRVEASFILWEGQDILQIPASALFREGNGWATFVVMNGKTSKRVVQVGQRNGLQAQILSGVQVDEQVISHPDDRVREGVAVTQR